MGIQKQFELQEARVIWIRVIDSLYVELSGFSLLNFVPRGVAIVHSFIDSSCCLFNVAYLIKNSVCIRCPIRKSQ